MLLERLMLLLLGGRLYWLMFVGLTARRKNNTRISVDKLHVPCYMLHVQNAPVIIHHAFTVGYDQTMVQMFYELL